MHDDLTAAATMRPQSDCLVITRAGKASLHPRWVDATGTAMTFDLLVGAYDKDAPRVAHERVFHVAMPGPKVAGIARMLSEYRTFIGHYRYVAIIDDDIDTDAATLARCFDMGRAFDLKIWQPALTGDSHFTYAGLVQNRSFVFRYVNFVEMMCPFFERRTLEKIAFLFYAGHESGIDLVWCNVGAGDKSCRFAVLDCCPVRHTRPVGAAKEMNGFVDGLRYENEIERVLARYDIPWLSCVPYAGVRHDGRIVTSRAALLARALPLLASVARAPGRALRLRAVLVHWKHLVTRTARNVDITPDGQAGA